MNNDTNLKDEIQTLCAGFNTHFIERDEEILGAVLAILSNENILYLGPPGTAKTYLAQSICRSIRGADFFYYLLTRFTTPEEIFGPLSIKSLENDEFRRKTDGCLPASHIAFLDEIFKANSSILNSLLTILNERQFHNGTEVIDTPLLTVFGASNELPEEDESLEALYDRFLFRYDVRYIQNEENVKTLLFMSGPDFSPLTTLTTEKIAWIREQSRSVQIPGEVQDIILSLKRHLEQRDSEEGDGFWVSDRRWKKITGVLRVAAAANGNGSIDRTMLLLLQHLLWDLPEQKEEIRNLIIDHLVTGGTDTEHLEAGILHLQQMLTKGDAFVEDVSLPVPVFAHDSDGNNQKIVSYADLVAASKDEKWFYFTVELSFSTGYPFTQIMDILQKEYQFSPKKSPNPDRKAVCEAEYVYLMEQFQRYLTAVREGAVLLKQNLEANIWLTRSDIDEVISVQQNRLARVHLFEEKMDTLTHAIRS
nr:AAA family ATPase [uncultured Methanospirillum sp.]